MSAEDSRVITWLLNKISKMYRHVFTFLCHLSLSWSRGGVDVSGALEVGVFLHSDEVGCKLPHVFPVVDYADHRVTAGEKVPVGRDQAQDAAFWQMPTILSHINMTGLLFISLWSWWWPLQSVPVWFFVFFFRPMSKTLSQGTHRE